MISRLSDLIGLILKALKSKSLNTPANLRRIEETSYQKDVMMISQQQLEFTEANEGYREHVYQCTANKDTIGIGYNLEAGMPHDLALIILQYFMEKNYARLALAYPWFLRLEEGQKIAIADMCYQLGFNGFSKFKNSIAFMAIGDYDNAAHEFLDSKWARLDTPERAKRVTDMIRG